MGYYDVKLHTRKRMIERNIKIKEVKEALKNGTENIDILKDKKVIDPKLADELKKLNGMRNAIAHKYENLNIELILNNLETVKEQLREFIDSIEGELS